VAKQETKKSRITWPTEITIKPLNLKLSSGATPIQYVASQIVGV
jgi:hypothetical protein